MKTELIKKTKNIILFMFGRTKIPFTEDPFMLLRNNKEITEIITFIE